MNNETTASTLLRVTYLEQTAPAAPPALHWGSERIGVERLSRELYLSLYRQVGEALRWDQRLLMPAQELDALLQGDALRIYVLRDVHGEGLGFCEFDRSAFPQIELKNFGLIPDAQGRGLGRWLLSTALQGEWRANPDRIWLHTDNWDHPAAVHVYQRTGFKIFDVRDEAAEPL
jgi:GNAT superfamily N-acetyltransferase